MFFEEIEIKSGDTIPQIAQDYGYNFWDWREVWEHHGNADVRKKRKNPENIQIGDRMIVPLPWKITSKHLTSFGGLLHGKTFTVKAKRDGVKGNNLRWVQTTLGNDLSLQSIPYAVGFPDDDDPSYCSENIINTSPSKAQSFFDRPYSTPHTFRTTTWNVVLSICSVCDERVSIFESIVLKVDFGKNGINTSYPIRNATANEISKHLNLLKLGQGQSMSFRNGSWTFREAPKEY